MILIYEFNKYIAKIFTLAEEYQILDNREKISFKQKNLLQIEEIPDLSNTIQSFLTLVTFKSNNQSLIAFAKNFVYKIY